MRKFPYVFILVFLMAAGIAALAPANDNLKKIDVYDSAYSSDSIDIIKQNKNFINTGLEVKELKEQTKIKREEAINIAKDMVKPEINLEAPKVTAVKALFTDNGNTQLIDKNIILKDYPVWIVTFHGIKVKIRSVPQGYKGDPQIFADKNVIIDAQTGEILESVSYSK